MTTFIKTQFKKLKGHTNIDKYRVAVNITEYHISKLIFLRICIPKFMKIKQFLAAKGKILESLNSIGQFLQA